MKNIENLPADSLKYPGVLLPGILTAFAAVFS